MSARQLEPPPFILGTAVKITTILSVPTATVKISIQDSANTYKVQDVSMTYNTDKVYTYTWQSATTDLEGVYVVTIKVTSGSYTTVKQEVFYTETAMGA